MTQNIPEEPDSQACSEKKRPSITPYTTMDGLKEFSDAELDSAGRTYAKSGRKNRNYRHIARLIKAEQKRRSYPQFIALPKGGQA